MERHLKKWFQYLEIAFRYNSFSLSSKISLLIFFVAPWLLVDYRALGREVNNNKKNKTAAHHLSSLTAVQCQTVGLSIKPSGKVHKKNGLVWGKSNGPIKGTPYQFSYGQKTYAASRE